MKTNGRLRLWAILFWLAVWEAASLIINQKLFLVPPQTVLFRLLELIREKDFWMSVLHSLLRILGGFLAAVPAGVLAAVLSAGAGRFRELLAPLMMTVKSVPVASFIILTLLFLPSRHLAVFISFLMVLPVIYTNVLEGILAMPRELPEMAMLFRVPFFRRVRFIYVPHVFSYFLAGASTAMGFAWKSGIAAEVIGMPSGSIGERLQQAKVYLDTPDLLAWTVVIVALSQLCTRGFARISGAAEKRIRSIGGNYKRFFHPHKNAAPVPVNDLTENTAADSGAGMGKDKYKETAFDTKMRTARRTETAGESAVISVRNLTKRFESNTVLEDFSADIPKGSATALMGPSGAGKTTLFRILAGLETADDGCVRGLEGAKLSAVFQEDRLCAYMSAAENILLVRADRSSGRKIRPWKYGTDKRELNEASGILARENTAARTNGTSAASAMDPELTGALKAFGLPVTPAPVSTWSGGMKRRVSLLRALLADWDVLFLDEPFKGLDEGTKLAVISRVREMTAGKTVILITHDEEEARLLGCSGIIAVGGNENCT